MHNIESPVDSKKAKKRKEKVVNLEINLVLTAQHKGGQSISLLAHYSNLSQSMIFTILKDKYGINDAVMASAFIKSTIITKRDIG